MPLLTMTGISKRYGATQALDGVSLELQPGETLALIGENGAGKSTLMKILSGATLPDGGRMTLAGNPYQPESPLQARQAGVAMIYQELSLARHLSIEDNIMLGHETHRFGFLRRSAQRPRVRESLARLGHPELNLQTPVSQLSVALQQIVEIARALILDAKVIVFDEPTSSLTRQDTTRLFELIRRLRNDGLGIVYISHFLEEVRQVCDRYAVLRDGRSAGSGRIEDVSDAEIVAQMVGRSVEELFPKVPHAVGEPLLRVQDLSGLTMPINVTLDVHRGEILGVAGLVGAGRTEFLRCLYGLDAIRSGRVTIAGTPRTCGVRSMIAAGVGLVSEDRKGEGLAQGRSIADNLTASRMDAYSRAGLLLRQRRDAAVRQWLDALRVKACAPDQAVSELSGGNQQKVAIARVLHQGAELLLLDEPTRGIDVGTKAEIYRRMGEAAARGQGVLFVSSSFQELLPTCDRIAVFRRGELVAVRPAAEWTEESLLAAAVGGSDRSRSA